MASPWRDLPGLSKRPQLCCDNTFQNGQCFGWAKREDGSWVGVVGRSVVALRDGDDHRPAQFRCLDVNKHDPLQELASLLQIETDLVALYKIWSDADPRLAQIASALPGMRVLRQEPLECLISFICSSNNNVPRIRMLVDALAKNYGEPIRLSAPAGAEPPYFAFPTLEALGRATEADLRALGLGYRAKFICGTVRQLADRGGVEWLRSLRGKPADDVRAALVELPGVGPKVADCVALFSLDATDAVPVDTHVWQIACRDFDRSLASARSLTPTVYRRVGDLFREKYGAHAGWAHSLLFAAELPVFRPRLPAALVADMAAFREEEKARKDADRQRRKRDREERARRTTEAAPAGGEPPEPAERGAAGAPAEPVRPATPRGKRARGRGRAGPRAAEA